jgi:PPOX class probable F420-dependent enzyme
MTADAPAWALALLREGRVGRLGTADAAGRPLVVPVCYAFDGACCYSAIDAKPKRTRALRRLANIAANPRVSLCVDHYEEDWQALRWVIVEGDAALLAAAGDRTRAVDLLVAKYPQYRALGLDREAADVIAITPARILAWRYADAAPPAGLPPVR